MTGQLKINGKDAYTTWGMSMTNGGLSLLLSFPPMKENVKNEYRTQHGVEVDRSNPKMAARELTFPIHFSAKTETQFRARYNSFCNELKTGFLDIEVSYMPNVVFRCEYVSCNQFSQYCMGIAKCVLRVIENNPNNRAK